MQSALSFNWDIHWICNYDCPYCWFHGQWAELKPRNIHFEPQRIIDAWKRIHAKYGRAKVAITGGEPLLYPHFKTIISEMASMHDIQIISNLSMDIAPYVEAAKGKNITINPSFHPLFADEDVFMERMLVLKEHGIMQAVTLVAWPPFVPKLKHYQERFSRAGIPLTIQSFHGTCDGRRYPDAYSAEEKEAILPNLGSRGGKSYRMEAFVTKGRMCNAGRKYGVIHPDGTVRRCGGQQSTDAVVGNLMDDRFKLLDEPRPCTAEVCPCNEWAFLLEKSELPGDV